MAWCISEEKRHGGKFNQLSHQDTWSIRRTNRSDIALSRHVFHDLMAYSCTFQHCDHGPFGSRTAWATHEQQHHLRTWRCPICHYGFDTENNVIRHVTAAHPSAIQGPVGELVHAASAQVERVSISLCPFCSDRHSWKGALEQALVPISLANAQDDRGIRDGFVSVSVYHRHVSRHMEQLALFAVPAVAGDDDESDTGDQSSRIATDEDAVASKSSAPIDPHSGDHTHSHQHGTRSPRYGMTSASKGLGLETTTSREDQQDIPEALIVERSDTPDREHILANRNADSRHRSREPAQRAPYSDSRLYVEADQPVRPGRIYSIKRDPRRPIITQPEKPVRNKRYSHSYEDDNVKYVVKDAQGREYFYFTHEEAIAKAERLDQQQRVNEAEANQAAYQASKQGNAQQVNLNAASHVSGSSRKSTTSTRMSGTDFIRIERGGDVFDIPADRTVEIIGKDGEKMIIGPDSPSQERSYKSQHTPDHRRGRSRHGSERDGRRRDTIKEEDGYESDNDIRSRHDT